MYIFILFHRVLYKNMLRESNENIIFDKESKFLGNKINPISQSQTQIQKTENTHSSSTSDAEGKF